MKDDRVYLQHIRDALNAIASYCGSDREGFFSVIHDYFGVNLEIVWAVVQRELRLSVTTSALLKDR